MFLRGVGSGGECGHGFVSWLGGRVGEDGRACAGEDVEAEVAASFGPFTGLFGQDGADEVHDRVVVGEDPDEFAAS